MTEVLQVGNRKIKAGEIVPLLATYQMLPTLLREIIIDEAIAEIECTLEEVKGAYPVFFRQHKITSDAERQAWLLAHGLTPEQLEIIVQRQVKIEKFKRATWGNKLESYFLQCKNKLDKAIYSLLRVQDGEVARELFFRLQAKEQSFAELARTYSLGPEAQTGGLVGPIELQTLHPTMVQMLSSCKPGNILPPTRVGEWFVIVKLEKFIPAQLDEAMRQRLLNELFNTWLQTQIKQVETKHLTSDDAEFDKDATSGRGGKFDKDAKLLGGETSGLRVSTYL